MRGDTNEERLFLYDDAELGIKKTDMPGIDEIIARHKARYHLGAFLVRPGMRVLDFPCGSGYGNTILRCCPIDYTGFDNDVTTLEYAKNRMGVAAGVARYEYGDLRDPKLENKAFDLICCIEGLEHIEIEYHDNLIDGFFKALKPGGKLLVSMPETPYESGPSPHNKYHLGELTFNDFTHLLCFFFYNLQFLTQTDVLHNGKTATLMYGICQKAGGLWKS